jgi:hypothetical protein
MGSHEGENFTFLKPGRDVEWDSIALLQGHAFATVGDRTYLWYSHWHCEEKFRFQDIAWPRSAATSSAISPTTTPALPAVA